MFTSSILRRKTEGKYRLHSGIHVKQSPAKQRSIREEHS